MAKALKVAAGVVAIAGLALVTGGLAAGASLSFIMGASSGVLGLTVGGLFTAAALLNTGASLLSPKPKVPDTSPANADRLTVSINTRAPRVSVVGSTAMATDLRDQEWSTDQAYLHRFIVNASHKIAGHREIWFDDKLAWTSTGGVQSAFAGFLDVTTITEGSAANAINIGPRMGASRRYTGLAYVYLRYKLSKNNKTDSPFASSIPSRMTIVGDGALFYDPRLDSTVPGGSGSMRADDQTTWAWSPSACRNPALAMLFYLLGWRIQNPTTGVWKLAVGKGIPASRLDLESFITAANLCDEAVATAAGGFEPRYRCDGVWSEGDDPSLVLENLKATMNAVLDDVDGKIRVTVLHNDLGAPIGTLTADDVQGAFTWTQTPALSDCVNVLRGGYTDASTTSLYQLVDFPEGRIDSPDGIDRAQTLNLPLVQSPSQAQRLVKTRLQRAQYPGAFQATFLSTAWRFQKGDVVRFSFFPLGWADKLFRIADTATQVDGLVPMLLREEHPSIYAFNATEVGAVQGAEPTHYDPSLWPLVQGIIDAGTTATWPGITGPGKPADNATNGADPNSPFGGDTVGGTLGRLTQAERDALAAKQRLAEFDATVLPAINQSITDAGQRADAARGVADQAVDDIGAEIERARGAEGVLKERIDAIVAEGGYDDAGLRAEVKRVDDAAIAGDTALGRRIDQVTTDYKDADTRTNGRVDIAAQAASDAAQAVGNLSTSVNTRFTGVNQTLGDYDQRITTLSNSTGGYAGRLDTLEAQFRGDADSAVLARVRAAETALTDGRFATAQRASDIEAAIGTVNGRVNGLVTATTDGRFASAQDLNAVSAQAGDAYGRASTALTAATDAATKLSVARLEFSAVTPGGRAQLILRSDNANGAGIDLIGDTRFLGANGGGNTISISAATGITMTTPGGMNYVELG